MLQRSLGKTLGSSIHTMTSLPMCLPKYVGGQPRHFVRLSCAAIEKTAESDAIWFGQTDYRQVGISVKQHCATVRHDISNLSTGNRAFSNNSNCNPVYSDPHLSNH